MIKVREPEKPKRHVTRKRDATPSRRTVTAECCPTCGRPIAKTPAERQRRHRARVKAKQ